jgi:phenylalanyl-tRNA synthetase alpha chain
MKDFEKTTEELREKFEAALAGIKDGRSLEELRNEFLSRKRGQITLLFEELKNLSPEKKPTAGKLLNDLKIFVQGEITSARERLSNITISTQEPISVEAVVPRVSVLAEQKPDLTLPGEKSYWGAPHPLFLFEQEIENIFLAMGFSVADGPEIETDYYNFEALNFPPHHPARDDWDTLYINDQLLLRTHT